ncbi:hypothetical protein CIB84_014880 [Bambusicola thoracicus]|uniref:PDZ domain-containing protein n=1 Tax=Bambusicola thoracicus TaxID=9083 RepID=A0A2P4SBA0_BAMTH|nr:hypothetical protein CIB84_014880 [Bambusicola thoracicus]
MAKDQLKPRLCHMLKGENGYGFHLHGEKGKSGQFIRKVEPGSPAEAAGLRAGDRVVEVNGFNVEQETHHQLVEEGWSCGIAAVEHRTGCPAGAVGEQTAQVLQWHQCLSVPQDLLFLPSQGE